MTTQEFVRLSAGHVEALIQAAFSVKGHDHPDLVAALSDINAMYETLEENSSLADSTRVTAEVISCLKSALYNNLSQSDRAAAEELLADASLDHLLEHAPNNCIVRITQDKHHELITRQVIKDMAESQTHVFYCMPNDIAGMTLLMRTLRNFCFTKGTPLYGKYYFLLEELQVPHVSDADVSASARIAYIGVPISHQNTVEDVLSQLNFIPRAGYMLHMYLETPEEEIPNSETKGIDRRTALIASLHRPKGLYVSATLAGTGFYPTILRTRDHEETTLAMYGGVN